MGRPKGTFKWPPKYERHKSGHARVRIRGKEYTLGRFGSVASHRKYNLLIARFKPTEADADGLPRVRVQSKTPVMPTVVVKPNQVLGLVASLQPSKQLVALDCLCALQWLPEVISLARLKKWVRIGIDGVRLEAIRLRKSFYSSEMALLLFLMQSAQAPTKRMESIAVDIRKANHLRAIEFLERNGM